MNSVLRISAIIIFCFSCTISVQAQSFQWANAITSEGFNEAFDLVADAEGNVYVAGQIEFLSDFGGGTVLESEGIHDIFLAKYSNTGNLIWAKRAGGRGGDKAQSIALDNFGHVYIVGEFVDTANFDNIIKISTGINDMFLAQYDTSGHAQWVSHIGSVDTLNTRGYGVTCDNAGNIYICGGTQGPTFYEGNFLFYTYGNNVNYDATFFKFDSSGNMIWARKIGSSDTDRAMGIAADNNGNIYVTGSYAGRGHFSPTDSIAAFGRSDVFLAKYDTAGNYQWAVNAGDTGSDRSYDVTINSDGNVIITGEFSYQGRFGPNTVYSHGLTDMFVAAYTPSGTNLWALSGGGPDEDVARGISHDNNGNILVAGDFGGSASFPPYNIVGNGYADAFLAMFNSAGTILQNFRYVGSPNNDRGRGVGVDPSGNVFFCGEFNSSIDFDSHHLTGDTLLDIFIAKFGIGSTQCSVQITSSGNATCPNECNGVAVASANGQGPYTYIWDTSPQQFSASATNLCAGIYSVVISDALGCTATTTVTINEPDPLQLTPNIDDASCQTCTDGSIDLIVNGGNPAYSFQWSNGDTTALISGLAGGDYSVCVTDANMCSLCDTFTVDAPTAIGEMVQSNLFTVYPNPFKDKIHVTCFQSQPHRIQLTNITGTIIFENVSTLNEQDFDVSELAAGVYFLMIVQDEKYQTVKILK